MTLTIDNQSGRICGVQYGGSEQLDMWGSEDMWGSSVPVAICSTVNVAQSSQVTLIELGFQLDLLQ